MAENLEDGCPDGFYLPYGIAEEDLFETCTTVSLHPASGFT